MHFWNVGKDFFWAFGVFLGGFGVFEVFSPVEFQFFDSLFGEKQIPVVTHLF